MRKIIYLFIVATLVICGCSSTQDYQSVEEKNVILFSKPMEYSIKYQGIYRNPIIFVHGLLGSNLTDTTNNENVWGVFKPAQMVSAHKLYKLAIPMRQNVALKDLTNSIKPSGILAQTKIMIGNNIELAALDNYDLAIDGLKKFGYHLESDASVISGEVPPSIFAFSYDWRRDISENVVKLHQYILYKRALLQKIYEEKYNIKDYDVKFDIVAHSMGGLLTRYYLQYGNQILPANTNELPKLSNIANNYVEKVSIVGTPNAGYPDTIKELISGLKLIGGAPTYPPQILGTFASYYFMMPHQLANPVVSAQTQKAIDIYDINNWIRLNWGLADKNCDETLKILLPNIKDAKERRTIALDHLNKNLKRAAQFKRALEVPLPKNDKTQIYLFAGDAMDTSKVLIVDENTGKIKNIIYESGDGKIPAVSARFDLRDWNSKNIFLDSPIPWNGIFYMGVGHMGFFTSSTFFTNLSSVLFYYKTARQANFTRE